MPGSKGLPLIFVILAFSLISMYFRLSALPSGDLGPQPKIEIFHGEKLAPVSWIKNRGARYSVWDVRKETDNTLVFMIVCLPENGTLIEDDEVTARVLAVRLALEMARLVQSIAKRTEKADQLVSIIGNVIDNSAWIAELNEQWKVARELRNLGTLFSQKAEVALTLGNVVASSKRQTEHLIRERGDQEAEHFLTTIASTGIAWNGRATLMISFVVRALELVGIPPAKWVNALYDKITYGKMPLLEALAQTFGRYETNRMFSQLAARRIENSGFWES